MANTLLLQCFIMGLFGIIFHVLIKIKSLKTLSKAGNVPFVTGQYFKEDWPAIALSIVSVIAVVFGFDEIANYAPATLKAAKWLFFFVGFCGSYILNYLLDKTKKAIMQVIDTKTDKLDYGTTKPDNVQG